MGYKMNVVARPQAVNQMTEFMNGFRERRGVKVIMKNNILESLKSLNKGECIGMLSDLNAREWGYQVNFFGKKASFYNAPVILSIRGKAPIIPTFTERSPDGKLTIRFEEPISWEKGESMVERIQKYVKRYENAFRRRPDLWCWFHERYKHSELGRIK
jgi:KDO2-lipid IV(A) lauroyltransferase